MLLAPILFNLHSKKFVEFPHVYISFLANKPAISHREWPKVKTGLSLSLLPVEDFTKELRAERNTRKKKNRQDVSLLANSSNIRKRQDTLIFNVKEIKPDVFEFIGSVKRTDGEVTKHQVSEG